MTLSSPNDQLCGWLSSPLPDSLCDLVLYSRKSSLHLPLVLAVAASPRLAHLLAGHADHEQVCVLIPEYCHHTMAALHHLITTGATFSLNIKHMAELKEVCKLLGVGQVARHKQAPAKTVETRLAIKKKLSNPVLGSASSAASIPSQHQPETDSSTDKDLSEGPLLTDPSDDLHLTDPCEGPPYTEEAASNEQDKQEEFKISTETRNREAGDKNVVNCNEVSTKRGSVKLRLRSAAVAASKKLEEAAASKRKRSSSHDMKIGRKLEFGPKPQQCKSSESKPGSQTTPVIHRVIAEEAQVRPKSTGSDINSNNCREEKFKLRSKVVFRSHGNVLFKINPRSKTKNYSGRHLLRLEDPIKPPQLPISSVTTSSGYNSDKAVQSKGYQIVDSKESGENFEFEQDAPIKCSTRKRRASSSCTKLNCKKIKSNSPSFVINTSHPTVSMPSPSSSQSCHECLKSSPSKSHIYPDQTSYKQHLTKTHFIDQILSIYPGMVCYLCTSPAKFATRHLLAVHIGTVHSLCYSCAEDGYSCGICDQTFSNGRKFKGHLYAHYKSQLCEDFKEVIHCPFCFYWSWKDLPRHMGVNHGLVFKYYDPARFMNSTPPVDADKDILKSKPELFEGVLDVITLD